MLNGSAKILYCNSNADSIVASAGRISTTKGNANDIYEKSCIENQDKNIKLIEKIIASGHTSVLEHIFFNISFNNVSVFVEQFMIEFRLASFTVKSRRYVDFGNMGYVTPEFKDNDELKKKYCQYMDDLFEKYNEFIEKGIPKEDARFVLPYSFRSNFYCSVNAREFLKIVEEMIYGRGKEYPEIVRLGKGLEQQCQEKFPFLKIEKNEKVQTAVIDSYVVEKKEPCDMGGESSDIVEILNATENPEQTICKAALLNAGYCNWDAIDVSHVEQQKSIIGEVLRKSRKRELEQVNYTILFKRVSLSGITHLVRHRMQSIVIPKYTQICDFNKYIIPDTIVNAGLTDEYKNIFEEAEHRTRELLAKGLEENDKAYLLLSGMTIPVITTMNANELFTFISLRSCNRAQWEIAKDAKALVIKLREKSSVLFSFYGPTCYSIGKCPEGRMSCGKMNEIKEEYSKTELL